MARRGALREAMEACRQAMELDSEYPMSLSVLGLQSSTWRPVLWKIGTKTLSHVLQRGLTPGKPRNDPHCSIKMPQCSSRSFCASHGGSDAATVFMKLSTTTVHK
eukprot:5943869-Amphidinium_carterae.2